MGRITDRLMAVRHRIDAAAEEFGRNPEAIELIAVSKTFPPSAIEEAMHAGQKAFGENYVQEALEKWPQIKAQFLDVKLHFIGKMQSNKVADALDLFDSIDSVDSEKLALEIQKQSLKKQKNPEIFIQVNIGQEPQKSGIDPLLTKEFVDFAKNSCKLNVVGLMSIPPEGEAPAPYFALLNKLAKESGLQKLSIGMSSDFEDAIALGATHIRVGEAIFGKRK